MPPARSRSPAAKGSAAALKQIDASPVARPKSPAAGASTSGPLPNKSGLPATILAAHSSEIIPPAFYKWNRPTMPHDWVSIWMIINVLIVIWDLTYVLLRPLSMHGTPGAASWSWVWAPYSTYGKVDGLYGMQGYLDEVAGKDHWNRTQSILNIVEVIGGIIFLWMVNYNDARANPWGIFLSTCTAYKTIIYFVLEHLSGYMYTGHNDPTSFWLLYVLPSSVWIIMPLAVVFDLSSQSVEKLDPTL